MRIMYDSVNYQAIPADAELVAGYFNGPVSEWPAGAWSRFTGVHVVIDVLANAPLYANVLDVKKGDATPADIGPWVTARNKAAPGTATVYCDHASWQECADAAAAAGVSPHWWVGDWTGEAHALARLKNAPAPVAVQFAAPGHGSAGDYDLSAVWDYTWSPGPTWIDQAITLAAQLAALLEAHA